MQGWEKERWVYDMFSLVRSGPKTLIFESSEISQLKQYLADSLDACWHDSYVPALEKAGEGYTIIFITDRIRDIISVEDTRDILVAQEEPDVILCRIINDGKSQLISRSRIAPRLIIMRAMGDMEKIGRAHV
mgnify:CR=1 FL=1